MTETTEAIKATEPVDAKEEQEDQALAKLEEELVDAERRAWAAEESFLTAAGLAAEMSKDEADRAASEKHHKGLKNAGSLPDRVVRKARWIAKRAQEDRVREATKRSRDIIRRGQRNLRFDRGVDGEDAAPPAEASKVPLAADSAEAKEMRAAQAKLEELVALVEALKLSEDEAYYQEARDAAREDYAEQVEEQHHSHKESHGSKNTSQLTDKQESCKKWEANQSKEQREREHNNKARDKGRDEARDRKADAATVD